MNIQTQGEYKKWLPSISPVGRPFWDAAKRHELVVQECRRDGTLQFPPRALCVACGRGNLGWKKLSGKGVVYSFTIIRQVISNSPAFQEDIPFCIGLIQLDEGPRIYSNIVGCKPEEVDIGMRVKVIFEDITPEVTFPKFKLATQ